MKQKQGAEGPSLPGPQIVCGQTQCEPHTPWGRAGGCEVQSLHFQAIHLSPPPLQQHTWQVIYSSITFARRNVAAELWLGPLSHNNCLGNVNVNAWIMQNATLGVLWWT